MAVFPALPVVDLPLKQAIKTIHTQIKAYPGSLPQHQYGNSGYNYHHNSDYHYT
jgi:hypothetical protein